MKQRIRVLLESLFGIQENMMLKINLSCLISSIIFSLFSLIHHIKSGNDSFFSFVAAVLFVLWIVLVKGINTLEAMCSEVARVLMFFVIFILTTAYILDFILYGKSISIGVMVLAIIGMECGIFYLVCKVVDIFKFIKAVWALIKLKLFNTDKPATSKAKAVIENVTAFLISIGGFAVAIKTILEAIFQIMNYFVK